MFTIDFFEYIFLIEAQTGERPDDILTFREQNKTIPKISFKELIVLAEVCIPPVPIARYMFFDNLSDLIS